jgi:hypothetical protein
LRIEYPGVFYNGISKGNQRGADYGMTQEGDKLSIKVNRIKAAMD